ncbi:MAG: hypothetical protein WAM40_23240, partial [Xanthobacteraceae bacterium]
MAPGLISIAAEAFALEALALEAFALEAFALEALASVAADGSASSTALRDASSGGRGRGSGVT